MLENAASAMESGNEQAADNMLQAFINYVEAQSGKHIDTDTATTLMNAATYIMNNN
ncbi:MAG: hypothetical protein HY754_07650 [Nitrospirae bacterium]|nr:hypothetical protein [Nitrospirota bacterium]